MERIESQLGLLSVLAQSLLLGPQAPQLCLECPGQPCSLPLCSSSGIFPQNWALPRYGRGGGVL